MHLHKSNIHNSGYDIDTLCTAYPELQAYIFVNKYDTKTIDFANPKAVKALNTALLKVYYHINYWEFPDKNLCPPIPGRVDYVHYLNDLLERKDHISVLDIGVGASCIYPLLGHAVYKWNFVGTDIDTETLKNANFILKQNKLNSHITLRHQKNQNNILENVINENDSFDLSMCNPPFYKTEEDALQATTRKLKGLKKDQQNVVRNFSGAPNELWYRGGEKAFLHNYIYESSLYPKNCLWFTSLVSKKDLVHDMKRSLKKLGAKQIKIINMKQGQKQSRIVAWTYKQI